MKPMALSRMRLGKDLGAQMSEPTCTCHAPLRYVHYGENVMRCTTCDQPIEQVKL